ncbi:hypothetical protein [Streptomyces ossamyceticus]|uniref:hypothetical protein n=1 Tax=Streptomyces ossamyceticus TaxID=249581 RepID=UPI00341E5AE0
MEWDLWNEPDLNGFWDRWQSQYLQMWSRFHAAVRAGLPGQLIVGPSTANPPNSSNTWWTTFLNHVKANNVENRRLACGYRRPSLPGPPHPHTTHLSQGAAGADGCDRWSDALDGLHGLTLEAANDGDGTPFASAGAGRAV